MGEWDKKTEEEKEQLIYEEESIIFSLTKLFVQHMMYLRVPTNACVEMRKRQQRRRELERKRKEAASSGGNGMYRKHFSLVNTLSITYSGH